MAFILLERINQVNDIKNIEKEKLPELAQEIREFLIDSISRTGGHLASNLGVVELTMALHLTFDLRIRSYGMWGINPIRIRY